MRDFVFMQWDFTKKICISCNRSTQSRCDAPFSLLEWWSKLTSLPHQNTLSLCYISSQSRSATVSLSTPSHCPAGWRECCHVIICAKVPIIFLIVQLKISLTSSRLPCTELFLFAFPFCFCSAWGCSKRGNIILDPVFVSKSRVYFKPGLEEKATVKDALIATGQKTCSAPGQRDKCALYLWVGSVKLWVILNKAWQNGNGSYLASPLYDVVRLHCCSCAKKRFSGNISAQ